MHLGTREKDHHGGRTAMTATVTAVVVVVVSRVAQRMDARLSVGVSAGRFLDRRDNDRLSSRSRWVEMDRRGVDRR